MKIRNLIALGLSCGSLWCLGGGGGGLRQIDEKSACLSIRLLEGGARPVTDGKYSAAEWARAAELAGFVQVPEETKGLMKTDRGFVHVAADAETIYLAIRTTTPNLDPGGGLVTAAKDRDGNVWSDDAVEIMINPDTDRNSTYHFIFNSAGVLYDRKVTYSPSSMDEGWNIPDYRCGSNANGGWWVLEAAIPRRHIGSPKDGVWINVARNWGGQGQSALIPTDSHVNTERMIRLTWGSSPTPLMKTRDLGMPGMGEWKVDMAVDQVPAGGNYRLSAELVRWEGGRAESVALRQWPVREALTAQLEAEVETLDFHKLYVRLEDLAAGRILYQRAIGARKGSATSLIPETATYSLPGTGTGVAYHYPGYNKAVLKCSLRSSVKATAVSVLTKCPDGSVKTSQGVAKGRSWSVTVPGGPAPGHYEHSFVIACQDGAERSFPSVLRLEKRVFGWENNSLGKDAVILPPFTPMVTEGNEVSVLYRRHRVNGSGLWSSVVSKDRELLASPMYFELDVGGRRARFHGEDGFWRSLFGRGHGDGAQDVVNLGGGYAARVSNQAQALGVALDSSTRIDYDGFFWNQFRLSNPESKTIRRLTLVIPLKASEARLFHAAANSADKNPAGAIPGGTGVVWTGDRVPQYVWYGKEVWNPQFVPYIWLGTEERGICWMAESSYGMRLDRKRPAVRIVRRPGVVQLEIDLINVPTAVEDGDGFSFGLMASPVKPIDRELFKYSRDDRGGKIPGMLRVCSMCDDLVGVMRFFKEPHKQDYELMDAMTRMVSTGGHMKEYQAALDRWDRMYLADLMEANRGKTLEDGEDFMTWWKRVRKNYLGYTYQGVRQGGALPVLYSDPRLIAIGEPVPDYFRSEWASGFIGYVYTYRSYPTPTNLDYMVYCYDQWLRHGVQGIYLDEVAIHANYNTDTAARVDRYGQLHSETGLLQLRELIRRIAVLQHLHGCRPRWLEVHMSNRLLIPCFSFATVQLGWEEHYGETEIQDRFPADYMKATLLGTKIGAVSWALDGIFRQSTPAETWENGMFQHLNRTMMAVLLPHNVRPLQRINRLHDGVDWGLVSKILGIYAAFSPWEAECRFVPYYQEDGALSGVPDGVLASSYRRPGRTLIMLGNQGDAKRFRLKLDCARLGVGAEAVLRDAETGQVIVDGQLSLPRRDFKVLWLGDGFEKRP